MPQGKLDVRMVTATATPVFFVLAVLVLGYSYIMRRRRLRKTVGHVVLK